MGSDEQLEKPLLKPHFFLNSLDGGLDVGKVFMGLNA